MLALEYLLNNGDTITVNLGTGHGVSARQVVDTVRRITGREIVAPNASNSLALPSTPASIDLSQAGEFADARSSGERLHFE